MKLGMLVQKLVASGVVSVPHLTSLACVPLAGQDRFHNNLNLPGVRLGSMLPGATLNGSVLGAHTGSLNHPLSVSLFTSSLKFSL